VTGKMKRDADGVTHSKPGSVDQQEEDSFPASDAPSFSPGVIGAPDNPPAPSQHSSGAGHKRAKEKAPKSPKKPGA